MGWMGLCLCRLRCGRWEDAWASNVKSYFFGQTQTYPDVTIDRFGQENNFEMTKVQMCVPGNMHGRSVSARGPETGNQSTHTHIWSSLLLPFCWCNCRKAAVLLFQFIACIPSSKSQAPDKSEAKVNLRDGTEGVKKNVSGVASFRSPLLVWHWHGTCCMFRCSMNVEQGQWKYATPSHVHRPKRAPLRNGNRAVLLHFVPRSFPGTAGLPGQIYIYIYVCSGPLWT